MDVNHGVSVRLSGSVNFFALYSVSSSKILVFAVRTVGDDGGGDDGVVVKLMRCSVIQCFRPVFSISVFFGSLVLGEENGVRVFNLRSLVKGRVSEVMNPNLHRSSINGMLNEKSDARGFHLPNGVITDDYTKYRGGRTEDERATQVTWNGYLDGRMDKHYVSGKCVSCIRYKVELLYFAFGVRVVLVNLKWN